MTLSLSFPTEKLCFKSKVLGCITAEILLNLQAHLHISMSIRTKTCTKPPNEFVYKLLLRGTEINGTRRLVHQHAYANIVGRRNGQ